MKLKKNKKKNSEINDGHYLELMDRLHVIMCTLDEHCIKHPLVKKEKEVKFALEYALGQLWDAYQEVGRIQSENIVVKPVRRWDAYQNESPKNTNEKNGIQKIVLGRHKNSKD